MADEGTEQETPAAAPAAKKRGGKMLLVGVALLAGGAGAAWWLDVLPPPGLGGPGRTAQRKAEPTPPRPAVGALYALEPFIANLADTEANRYLKASLQLEFFATRVPDEMTAQLPRIRDLLLTLLTSKLFSEVRTPEGKAVLRDEIVNRVNQTLRHDAVKAVYFTEFIVQ